MRTRTFSGLRQYQQNDTQTIAVEWEIEIHQYSNHKQLNHTTMKLNLLTLSSLNLRLQTLDIVIVIHFQDTWSPKVDSRHVCH
jgi:hypothetical protein